MYSGYKKHSVKGRIKWEHRMVAEAALGRPMTGAENVHHLDGNPANNSPSNLVVCPDMAYHKLLEQRQRALGACGHADWRVCVYCGEYDEKQNMRPQSRKHPNPAFRHIACHTALNRARKQARAA